MLRFESFTQQIPSWTGNSWKITGSLGLMLVLFAVSIILAPELLALLFATAVLWAGIGLMILAYRIRKVEKQPRVHSTTIWF